LQLACKAIENSLIDFSFEDAFDLVGFCEVVFDSGDAGEQQFDGCEV
jgi:hypothetical protein